MSRKHPDLTGQMFTVRSKDWQLKTKDQLQMLEQDQLNTYVSKFIKKKGGDPWD